MDMGILPFHLGFHDKGGRGTVSTHPRTGLGYAGGSEPEPCDGSF